MKRQVDRKAGRGTVYLPNGSTSFATYELHVWEAVIDAKSDAPLRGLREARGYVTLDSPHIPVQFLGKKLTLGLLDDEKIDFFFEDANGKVVCTGPFYR